MPAFPFKIRTLESYLAGLGASSALIAGAFVAFIVLVGIVTFDAWPTGSSVFSRGAGDVSVDTNTTTPAAQQAKPPNLVKLLGGGHAGGAAPAPTLVGRNGAPPSPNGPSTGGHSPGQPQGGGNPGGGGQQPSSPGNTNPPSQPGDGASVSTESVQPNLLQQTVSDLGNDLQSDTDSLSNTLGGSGTLLGGVVGGLGNTLNGTLQNLAGTGN